MMAPSAPAALSARSWSADETPPLASTPTIFATARVPSMSGPPSMPSRPTSGVRRGLYTDVRRDGMLGGADIDGTRAVAKIVGVLASGGVSSAEQLRALKAAGAEGAIIGSALYEGRLTLSEALAATAC